ncbi:putative phosphoketolase [Aureobasidium pullulans EXF-150]|uniref:Putative phosphoketolase n=1 Tax=Aureobasidium pullulans EXF-150 TaxID=1043002 RepID=A0A074Y6W6_AURPU|nr:putative phosphoketolase [Aureobasidium pullulans EXF-150]KEQ89982.1 putative phosphoketolase [Aureobasidium pullulans EXF-150]
MTPRLLLSTPSGCTGVRFSKRRKTDKNFHSYPWLLHRMTYKRKGQHLMRVRGYKEKGNIDTPLELAIRNETDRYSLAMLAIDSLKSVLGNKGSATRETLLNRRTQAMNYAYECGEDPDDFVNWTWNY